MTSEETSDVVFNGSRAKVTREEDGFLVWRWNGAGWWPGLKIGTETEAVEFAERIESEVR